MNQDQAWAVIDQHRLDLTDLLSELSPAEWDHPSLCRGWSARDVVAHITMQHAPAAAGLGAMVRARGNMDRAIHDWACRRAASTPVEDLVAEVRGMVGSRRHPPVVTYRETLIDALVHAQDIVRPLGRVLDTPPDAAAAAAARVWSLGYPWYPKRRLAGFRLTATDADWTRGEGAPVQAPMAALLLLVTGRDMVVPQLTGEGAEALTGRLAAR